MKRYERMNARTQLINDIKCQLFDSLDHEQMEKLDNVLHAKLGDYEVQERCTDVALVDDSPIKILQKFAISKKIEGLSDKTIRRYYEQCAQLLVNINKPIEEIDAFDIRGYLLSCKQNRDVSNRTLDGMRRCYSSFFGWCYTEDIISSNPCKNVPQIKYEKTIKLPYTEVEVEKMKCACDTIRDRALIEFLYATGCRVSEVSQLDRDSINYNNKTAMVLGKGSKERIVYITNVAMFYLVKYLESRDDEYPALFIGKNTTRLSKNGIEAVIHRIGDRAGVKDAYPHKYRRTLATDMIKRGVEIQNVAYVMGHKDISTTKIYCYITEEDVGSVYNKYIS